MVMYYVMYYPVICTLQKSNNNILFVIERKTLKLIFESSIEISGKWMIRKNYRIIMNNY